MQEALLPLLDRAAKESFDQVARVEKDSSPIPPPDPKGHPDLVANLYLAQVVPQMMFRKITPEQAVALLREKAPAILQK